MLLLSFVAVVCAVLSLTSNIQLGIAADLIKCFCTDLRFYVGQKYYYNYYHCGSTKCRVRVVLFLVVR